MTKQQPAGAQPGDEVRREGGEHDPLRSLAYRIYDKVMELENGEGGCSLYDYCLAADTSPDAERGGITVDESKVDPLLAPIIEILREAALSRPAAGEPREDPDPWIRPCPVIYSVQGAISQSAFFNRASAERFIAERKEPHKFTLVEYVPAPESSLRARLEALAESWHEKPHRIAVPRDLQAEGNLLGMVEVIKRAVNRCEDELRAALLAPELEGGGK